MPLKGRCREARALQTANRFANETASGRQGFEKVQVGEGAAVHRQVDAVMAEAARLARNATVPATSSISTMRRIGTRSKPSRMYFSTAGGRDCSTSGVRTQPGLTELTRI